MLIAGGDAALRRTADLDHGVRLPDEAARLPVRRLLAAPGEVPDAGVRDRPRNPRISLMLWFLVRDEPDVSGWQSGLITVGGKKKPSLYCVPASSATSD